MAIFNTVYGGEYHLPWTYQKVEYIQSSWTQKIDTWYTITSNMKIECDYSTIGSWNDNVVFWTTIWSWWWTSPTVFNSSGTLHCTNGSGSNTFSSYTTDTRHILELSSSSVKLDSSTISWSPSFNTSYKITLFAWNSKYGSIRFYACKIYTGTTLQREFIPCYRKSDSVIWMYDLVNNQFYTNAGSWTFTKWPDVN